METLHVGLVGAGWIGSEHARGWRANAPRSKIVAVADASPARADAVIRRFTDGDARAYAGIDDLLADPAVEAVDVCLPHHLHTEAVVAAARAGKAILCEKPLCTSLADAAAIGAVLAETGVPFMTGHNQLFQPSLIEALRLLATGALGRPAVLRSIEAGQNRGFNSGQVPLDLGEGESPWAWRLDPARMGGGELLDTGWHATYRLLALSGERPVAVTAMTERFFVRDLAAEDTALVLVRFASGAIGEIVTSWAFTPVGRWQFEVLAEQGSLAGGPTRLLHQLPAWPSPAEYPNEPVHTFTAEIAAFLDVVQRGAPNRATFADAARVLQVIQAAYASVAARRAVALPLPDDPLAAGVPVAEEGAAAPVPA